MGRILIILAIVMLTIYCVVEVAQSQPSRIRVMPKWLWAFVVICVPIIGPVTWLLAGRPENSARRHALGPDDDEDFLRGLR
ncbi:MAG: PLD nuclease N-terminal domain-containing protein [Arachnia sp.]